MTYMGTSINESPVITDKAGAAIEDVRGKAVKFSGNALVLCDTAGETAIGIGIMTNTEKMAKGDDITVQVKDIGLARAGAAIAKGAELAVDANGTFVTATAGQFVVAVALAAAANAGEYIKVRLTGYQKNA